MFLDTIKVYRLRQGLKLVPNLFGFYVLKLITNLSLGKKKKVLKESKEGCKGIAPAQPWHSLWFLSNDCSTTHVQRVPESNQQRIAVREAGFIKEINTPRM